MLGFSNHDFWIRMGYATYIIAFIWTCLLGAFTIMLLFNGLFRDFVIFLSITTGLLFIVLLLYPVYKMV